MKFVIEKGALLRELTMIQQSVVDKRPNAIPALGFIRIEASGKRAVQIIGTDLDQTLQCETEGQVQKAGVAALPGKKLFEIIRQLPDAEVHFESRENDRITVTCERAQFKLAGMNPEDWPELPKFKESSAQLPADVVRQMIERTRFCITQEESRYTLSGAKFILRKRGLRMVSTDGHRLALIDNRALRSEQEFEVLLPRAALAAVSRLASAHEGAVGINCDENHAYFEIGARTLTSRLLTGVFPNYEMVIPKDNDHKVEFDCAELLHAVRRVSIMTNERSRAIRLEFTKNKLTVRAEEAEQGAAEETIEIEYAGAPAVIGINSGYLTEYLSVVGSGHVRFEFKDGKSPVQIRPLGEAGYNSFNIIMPMYLGDVTPAPENMSAAEEETEVQEEEATVAQAA